MKEAALIHKKKKFIEWFLGTFRIKRPEAVNILKYLMDNTGMLARTHFVENVRYLPNALIISAEGSSTVSFLCRINNVYYEDIHAIIAELEQCPPEDLFVWLSFDREFICSSCSNVLHINQEVDESLTYYTAVKELEKELNLTIQAREKHKAKLLREIDETLERGDRERFLTLSSLYRELFS